MKPHFKMRRLRGGDAAAILRRVSCCNFIAEYAAELYRGNYHKTNYFTMRDLMARMGRFPQASPKVISQAKEAFARDLPLDTNIAGAELDDMRKIAIEIGRHARDDAQIYHAQHRSLLLRKG